MFLCNKQLCQIIIVNIATQPQSQLEPRQAVRIKHDQNNYVLNIDGDHTVSTGLKSCLVVAIGGPRAFRRSPY